MCSIFLFVAHLPLTLCFRFMQADFRDYPPLLRQAVSVARKIQDPLVEYAQVCSTDEDILCLKLHPLQVRDGRNGGFMEFNLSLCMYLIFLNAIVNMLHSSMYDIPLSQLKE